MKIAITGHTQGFGKFLFKKYNENNTVFGFSRSTGFDITKKTDRERIISLSSEMDIFINCAQDGFAQTELLYDLFQSWKKQKRLILNIGSNARDFINSGKIYDYSVQKQALNSASRQLGRLDVCRVATVDFGYLVRPEHSSIGYSEASEYIDIALQSLGKQGRLLEILVAHD